MIELVQFPWSPFCIVQRRILEFSGVRFKLVNIPNGDRSLVWRLTRQRYYQVPVLKDRRTVVFETGDDSQVIAKYLDDRFKLGLFPREWEGVQTILWRFIENEIEGSGFRLNDIYYQEMVPVSDRLRFIRHKERKFGRGCLEQWRQQLPEATFKGFLTDQSWTEDPQFLAGVTVPALVVAAENDVFSVERLRLTAARIPGAHFALIRRASHMAPFTAIETFREILTTFIRTGTLPREEWDP